MPANIINLFQYTTINLYRKTTFIIKLDEGMSYLLC